MPKTDEKLTAPQRKRERALHDSFEYARAVERSHEMQEVLKRKRVPGRSLSREEFRNKYLA